MDSSMLKQQLLYTPFYSWGECQKRYGKQVYEVVKILKQDTMDEHDMLMIGNEIMYQITRAYDDPHPEEGVFVHYIEEIQNKFARDNSWECTVVGIMLMLYFQVDLPDKISAFLSQLRSLTIDNDFCNFEFTNIKKLWDACRISLNIDYTPCPVAPKALITDKNKNSWKGVTDNYYQPAILNILSRYKSKKDQRLVLKMIKSEFGKTEVTNQEFIDTVINHMDGTTSHFQRTEDDFFQRTEKALDIAIRNELAAIETGNNPMIQRLKDLFTFRPAISFNEVGMPSYTIDFGPSPEVLELRQSLSQSCAKVDMLAQENALLKQKLADMAEGKETTKHQFLVEHPELAQNVNFDSVVNAALASHDVKFVHDVLTLLYKLTGRALSEYKDRRLSELEAWQDELHMRQGGIYIKTLNQNGGIISETINMEINKKKG